MKHFGNVINCEGKIYFTDANPVVIDGYAMSKDVPRRVDGSNKKIVERVYFYTPGGDKYIKTTYIDEVAAQRTVTWRKNRFLITNVKHAYFEVRGELTHYVCAD